MMRLLELSLDRPAANLAVDEALLERAERGEDDREWLRLWEFDRPVIVLGRSSAVKAETRPAARGPGGPPLLRRSSGGAAIVAGPGCLMYSLVLRRDRRPEIARIDAAHALVLERLTHALRRLHPDVQRAGVSDLALGLRKFSGNSLRCKRRCLLYHGALLYDFPLERISQWLAPPPRQPAYRAGRSHDAFLINFPADRPALRRALLEAWDRPAPSDDWPRALTETLAADRYGQAAWTWRRP